MIGKFPLIIRPAFTLGGTGGGIAYNMDEYQEIVNAGLNASVTNQVSRCLECLHCGCPRLCVCHALCSAAVLCAVLLCMASALRLSCAVCLLCPLHRRCLVLCVVCHTFCSAAVLCCMSVCPVHCSCLLLCVCHALCFAGVLCCVLCVTPSALLLSMLCVMRL